MALRLWCNPRYFPAELQGIALAAASAVLSARNITLAQVREVQVYIDQACDNAETASAQPPHVVEWERAWLDAIRAAEAAGNVPGPTPLVSLLVLDESDDRFGLATRRLH
jgi:hypothetical protein